VVGSKRAQRWILLWDFGFPRLPRGSSPIHACIDNLTSASSPNLVQKVRKEGFVKRRLDGRGKRRGKRPKRRVGTIATCDAIVSAYVTFSRHPGTGTRDAISVLM
jgi:hypothetical protein